MYRVSNHSLNYADSLFDNQYPYLISDRLSHKTSMLNFICEKTVRFKSLCHFFEFSLLLLFYYAVEMV